MAMWRLGPLGGPLRAYHRRWRTAACSSLGLRGDDWSLDWNDPDGTLLFGARRGRNPPGSPA
jgi:hypothetical protein